MALGGQVIDLVRSNPVQQADQGHGVREVAVMQENVAKAKEIIVELARAVPDPSGRPATTALAGAIITKPDCISSDVRDKLRPLIGKYLP